MTIGDEVQLVTFRVGGRDFAFNVFQVERILRFEQPTALPQAPAFLEGTIRYGEALVPVIDLRKRLEVDAAVRDETRIMVVDWEEGSMGLVVDAVLEVLKVPADRVTAPPSIVKGLAADYITGLINVGERTVVLLAVSKLLSSKERVVLSDLSVEMAHE